MRLPIDLFLFVLSKLTDPDLLNAVLVCKNWKNVIYNWEQRWKSFDFQKDIGTKYLERWISKVVHSGYLIANNYSTKKRTIKNILFDWKIVQFTLAPSYRRFLRTIEIHLNPYHLGYEFSFVNPHLINYFRTLASFPQLSKLKFTMDMSKSRKESASLVDPLAILSKCTTLESLSLRLPHCKILFYR